MRKSAAGFVHRYRRTVRTAAARIRPRNIYAARELQTTLDLLGSYPGSRSDNVYVLPLDRARAMRVMPLVADKNPFVAAAEALIADVPDVALARAILRSYYEANCPRNFTEWIGPLLVDAPVGQRPPFQVPFPWFDHTIEEQDRASQHNADKESRAAGRPLTVAEFWPPIGPMSGAGIDVEVRRLLALADSVRANGFRPNGLNDRPVSARLLVGEDSRDWCWQVKRGNHRTTVAAALGITQLPVEVLAPVVRRSEATSWPGVSRHYYSAEQAIAVFDTVLDGLTIWGSRDSLSDSNAH